jgi:hypothetical protein
LYGPADAGLRAGQQVAHRRACARNHGSAINWRFDPHRPRTGQERPALGARLTPIAADADRLVGERVPEFAGTFGDAKAWCRRSCRALAQTEQRFAASRLALRIGPSRHQAIAQRIPKRIHRHLPSHDASTADGAGR